MLMKLAMNTLRLMETIEHDYESITSLIFQYNQGAHNHVEYSHNFRLQVENE